MKHKNPMQLFNKRHGLFDNPVLSARVLRVETRLLV